MAPVRAVIEKPRTFIVSDTFVGIQSLGMPRLRRVRPRIGLVVLRRSPVPIRRSGGFKDMFEFLNPVILTARDVLDVAKQRRSGSPPANEPAVSHGPSPQPRLVTLLGLTAPLAGQDFPQWRGPQRDGGVSCFDIPQTWPARLTRVWSIDVGLGHASPIVVGDRVWLFAREDGDEVLGSYELATGRAASRAATRLLTRCTKQRSTMGRDRSRRPYRPGDVVTLGISGILSGHSAEGGSRAWQRRFDDAFESTSPTYGAAMSPLVEDGRVIAHVGGSGDGALGAFDLATGKTIWMWRGDGPGYAFPDRG